MCLYHAGELRGASAFAPGETWRTVNGGFRRKEMFVDLSGEKQGKYTLVVKSGAEGQATIKLSTPGLIPPDPRYLAETPVTIQLVNEANGVCFESIFEADDVTKNRNDTSPTSDFFGPWGLFKATDHQYRGHVVVGWSGIGSNMWLQPHARNL